MLKINLKETCLLIVTLTLVACGGGGGVSNIPPFDTSVSAEAISPNLIGTWGLRSVVTKSNDKDPDGDEAKVGDEEVQFLLVTGEDACSIHGLDAFFGGVISCASGGNVIVYTYSQDTEDINAMGTCRYDQKMVLRLELVNGQLQGQLHGTIDNYQGDCNAPFYNDTVIEASVTGTKLEEV